MGFASSPAVRTISSKLASRGAHPVSHRMRSADEISFTATGHTGETITVDAAYVNERVAPLAQKGDLSRFIL
jgi:ATP-dependent HslUV protease ATP-binding subunit HslU